MNLSIQEIAKAVQAKNQTSETGSIHKIEFDSRIISKGDLFVPLAGTRDGHEFIQQAIENGAVAAFWSKAIADAPDNIVIIQVADTLAAMQQLAKYYLKKVAPRVIAITGSNGKTTTKDMTEAVLARRFHTYKTQGNYNNDIGLPYTILHMPAETEAVILEMGMDHSGEIEFLSSLAEPDVAAITMIGEAHIENLGSREGIARAKMEIVSGFAPDGLLLVPANEPLLLSAAKKLIQTVTTFGLDNGVISGHITDEQPKKTSFEINQKAFAIPVLGSYNVQNALIAYGIGSWFGLTNEEIGQGLASFQLTQNRTQWLKAANGADLLSDVYNANPTAMRLVLDTFAALKRPAGQKKLVLADMLALGENSATMHAEMAAHIDSGEIAEVFLLGEEMVALQQQLAVEQPDLLVHHFKKEQRAELIQGLQKSLQPDDILLLKGSNGMELNKVVAALLEK